MGEAEGVGEAVWAMAEGQKNKLDALAEWLGLPTDPDLTKARWLGHVVGWVSVALYGAIVLTLAVGLIAVLFATIGRFLDPGTASTWEGYRWGLLTIATLTASLGAAIALPLTMLKTRYTQRQTIAAEQNLITTRINEAVEGLGAEKVVKVLERGPDGTSRVVERTEPNIEVRVGAILSLERISQNSPEDHVRIMEILCAYVRENACIVPVKDKPREPEDWKQRTDTQMAVTVIGRRAEDRVKREIAAGYQLDLQGANLQLSDLSSSSWKAATFAKANLTHAVLFGANFEETDFGYAVLHHALLDEAVFRGAFMGAVRLTMVKAYYSDFTGAMLGGAQLAHGQFGEACFDRAILRAADFSDAFLGQASLKGAQCERAKFLEACVSRADLSKANLEKASFSGADLRLANLAMADLTRAKLQDADLQDCTLNDSLLVGADMSESVNLAQEAVETAFGCKDGPMATKLPPDLNAPIHWFREADKPQQTILSSYHHWVLNRSAEK
ncbi:pentapeptide repeat-containing protein [Dinoroseobacter sp. PD6]|uniref:pentapeptide repeat-containing protein n=1 Tax=Dinoroseobacter sp. PD6 TaxID=3028384 RepID=UPI00237C518C|nr:pentapeptide repeat-containing protein [Dinoroseobacter sp. PD6]MDD9715297.1 pentapeptide repeat-containing protein [Dinoroseobacter sp. PD6]